jgi:hypothetical protein
MRIWKSKYTGEVREPELVSQRIDGAFRLMSEASENTCGKLAAPQLFAFGSGNGLAALLVPEGLSERVVRNGVPLPPGAHLLQHTDRIDYAGQALWVAAASEAREVPYAAAAHGSDVYCFVTKVRLQEGETIVVCPGRPGTECAAMYRKAAWEMALAANARFRCPRCGFEPEAGQWRPELPRASRLPQLFALARQHHRGDAL